MINQRWLYTKQAIQRYLQGIIFLWKKHCRSRSIYVSSSAYFILHVIFLKKKKNMSASLTQFLDSYIYFNDLPLNSKGVASFSISCRPG